MSWLFPSYHTFIRQNGRDVNCLVIVIIIIVVIIIIINNNNKNNKTTTIIRIGSPVTMLITALILI